MAAGRRAVLAAMAGGLLAGCTGPKSGGGDSATPSSGPAGADSGAAPPPTPGTTPSATASTTRPPVTRAEIVARYGRSEPHTWGFDAPGVVHSLPRTTRDIALTFDACGGPGGSGYDRALIDLLRARHIPATLFLNSRWIDANPAVFHRLAGDPLFEIANHGTRHRPLSVTGRSAYGIPGTKGAGEVYDEIAGNQAKLARLLGAPPRFFRSGTAYCDDIAARIVTDLGERFVSFSVNGDGGATFTAEQVHTTVASARAGSIVLCHMNHPEGGTAGGIASAVPHLLARGHRFVRLSDGLHRT
ncbi:polysaccharide deacetylase family protein [Streptomyces barringtoniae]|uniref:polysaccharide deacetylase family protein n=1 Tax=Streptomyces barringtoniae TaxID=2892029 RepID=UPI001E319F45|nr:polysaccharide deacetylase family protein [Streptomyces barringtoniae]MCC5474684.1 polysaccharide deacetylase family protein [Streptomyces barringtoniae]